MLMYGDVDAYIDNARPFKISLDAPLTRYLNHQPFLSIIFEKCFGSFQIPGKMPSMRRRACLTATAFCFGADA